MPDRDTLIAAARAAAEGAYAPYSRFRVGAALAFADGTVVTGANVENASYGLSLCAETVAAGRALSDAGAAAMRAFAGGGEAPYGGLVAVAVAGGAMDAAEALAPIAPCGRCRQVLSEIAQLSGEDPWVWGAGLVGEAVAEARLGALLPGAFGAGSLKV